MSHDLSGHLVKLDYKGLVATAELAVRHIRWAIEEEQRDLRETLDRRNYPTETTTLTRANRCAENLRSRAQELVIAVETLMALKAMESREIYMIRNHPSEEKYCPVCGQRIHLSEKTAENNKLVGSCGCSFYQFVWENEAEGVNDETH